MRTVWAGLAGTGRRTLTTLVDLVLPADCAGCAAPGGLAGLCESCAGALAPAPAPTRPIPAPPGLPPCVAGGEYDGVLREVILSYKERGRRSLAAVLGGTLATVVRTGLDAVPAPLATAAGEDAGRSGEDFRRWALPAPRRVMSGFPLVLVPVPATAAAIRARHGDHMLVLARGAARRLRGLGWPVMVDPALRALPKPDSAHLDRQARARAALDSFVVRPGRAARLAEFADAGVIVLVDDVLTTGSTLAAVARRLLAAGAPVAFAATLAATRLRHRQRS